MPQSEDPTRLYDTKYFSRDTRRAQLYNEINVITHPSLGVSGDGERQPLIGSPGTFGNPAVAKYDESGLRSAMTSTHEAMNQSIAKYMPTQLPVAEWQKDSEDIVAKYTKDGTPEELRSLIDKLEELADDLQVLEDNNPFKREN